METAKTFDPATLDISPGWVATIRARCAVYDSALPVPLDDLNARELLAEIDARSGPGDVATLRDALLAACAYVELYTANGTKQQPPAWAINAAREFDPEEIAKRSRAALAGATNATVYVARWDVKGEDGAESFATREGAINAILQWANDYGWIDDEYVHQYSEEEDFITVEQIDAHAQAAARATLEKHSELHNAGNTCHYYVERSLLGA